MYLPQTCSSCVLEVGFCGTNFYTAYCRMRVPCLSFSDEHTLKMHFVYGTVYRYESLNDGATF